MGKKWQIPAVAALVVAGGAVAVPAYAADVTCDEDLGSAVVDGNLIVPADGTCVLGGATVNGDILVGVNGWLDATSVEVSGEVFADNAYGVSIDGSNVDGDITAGHTGGGVPGFLYLNDLSIGGSVTANNVSLELRDSSVAGAVNTSGAEYVDVIRTSVTGSVSIDGSAYGVTVAGLVTQGDLTVSNSERDLLIGADDEGGRDAFGNTIGGNLYLTDNSGNLQVAGTVVYGAANMSGNDPVANFGEGNAAGSVDGDFTGVEPGAAPDGDQEVVVTVPEQGAGEFTWWLEGTSSLVDLGTAVEQLNYFEAFGEIVPIGVQDTRAGNPAWSITAVVSDFTAAGQTVSSKYLGWTPEVIDAAGGAVAGAPVPSGFDSGDGLSVARTLASAAEGHPREASIVGADLELKLPLSTPQGTYNATVTLTALS